MNSKQETNQTVLNITKWLTKVIYCTCRVKKVEGMTENVYSVLCVGMLLSTFKLFLVPLS